VVCLTAVSTKFPLIQLFGSHCFLRIMFFSCRFEAALLRDVFRSLNFYKLPNSQPISFLLQIIPAIRSRCLSVRVASPTEAQIIEILNEICTKEGLELPSKLADRIASLMKLTNPLQTHAHTHMYAHTHAHTRAHTHPHMYAHTNTTELQRSPTGTFAVQFSCVRLVASPRVL